MASAAACINLPASGATTLMTPRVSKLASARGTFSMCECPAVGFDASVVRLPLGQAHGGDLRIGKHHGRHGSQSRVSLVTPSERTLSFFG